VEEWQADRQRRRMWIGETFCGCWGEQSEAGTFVLDALGHPDLGYERLLAEERRCH